MLLSELFRGLEYRLFGLSCDTQVSRPFSDSRECVPGGVFICIKGERADGHDHAAEAIERGAVAAVCKKRIDGIPCIVVRDTRYVLAAVWNNYYGRPAEGMRLCGITGTCGKTTVATLVAACLREDGRRVGLIGTLGCFADGEKIECEGSEITDAHAAMTTPDPAYLYSILWKFKKRGMEDVVMEVSSHAILQKKVDPLSFAVTVFTNLYPEHLDAHKSMEEYFRVKASFVARGERRVVNCDNGYCLRFAKKIPSSYVLSPMAENVTLSVEGTAFDANLSGARLHIESTLSGDFTVENTMLAAGAALALGVGEATVEKGIYNTKIINGRMERVVKKENELFDVVIDYAHTPDALERALVSLRNNTRGKLICVFGCGGERDKTKRPLMGAVAEKWADTVIVTSDNPRGESSLSIIRDILAGIKSDKCTVIPSRREAIFAAVYTAEEGDTVLLAGKGHEKYEIGERGFSFFDEKEVVFEAMRSRNGK